MRCFITCVIKALSKIKVDKLYVDEELSFFFL